MREKAMKRLLATAALATTAALAAAAPATAAAAPTAHTSIIGGHVASIAEFPSIAYIEFGDATGIYSCTGSVVSPRVVLTAGHCVENVESNSLVPAHGYAVATGVGNIARIPPTNVSDVSQVLLYPGFRPTQLTGDAGLLILSAPVSAPPLPLASGADAALLGAGTQLSIAGWGLTNPFQLEGPTRLRAGTTTVQSPEYCQQRTKGYYRSYSADAQLCAVDRSSRSTRGCYGDSGGPAIAHRPDGTAVEIGVASSVKPGCIAGFPTVFTRADQINSWVASWIAAVEAGGPTPAITIPRAHLPLLTAERAEELGFAVLEEDLGSRFRPDPFEFHCARVNKAKVRCVVRWFKGGNDYYGKITVFYLLEDNTLFFGAHYTIKSARISCLLHSPRPRTCPVKTRRH
jgi:secreted trypsin-like serine protease